MAARKSTLPQGTLDLLILRIVSQGPVYGYGVAAQIQQLSREVLEVQQGSLYPALHRLESRGLLAAHWKESESGRDAKFYHLTAKGRAETKAETAQWERLSEAVTRILRATEGVAK
jgi:transcriptional regulator